MVVNATSLVFSNFTKFLKNSKLKTSWQQVSEKVSYKIWRGYAFESLCLKHILPIKKVLGIHGIVTNEYTWFHRGDDENKGTQIDLVIDRSDNCINLFELKFYNQELEIDKKYETQLRDKMMIFKAQTKTKKSVFLTLLTTFGAKKNKYYLSAVTNQLTIEDLFVS